MEKEAVADRVVLEVVKVTDRVMETVAATLVPGITPTLGVVINLLRLDLDLEPESKEVVATIIITTTR